MGGGGGGGGGGGCGVKVHEPRPAATKNTVEKPSGYLALNRFGGEGDRSELQSRHRNGDAVFCLKKKKKTD